MSRAVRRQAGEAQWSFAFAVHLNHHLKQFTAAASVSQHILLVQCRVRIYSIEQ